METPLQATRNLVCTSCDGFCPIAVKIRDGRVVKVSTRDHLLFKDVICMKGAYAPKSFAHPDRLLYALRRTGAHGEGGWERVSWDSATDGIAERLTQVIQRHGPEAFAVASSVANYGNDNGLSRRFMNLFGCPISSAAWPTAWATRRPSTAWSTAGTLAATCSMRSASFCSAMTLGATAGRWSTSRSRSHKHRARS